MTGLQQIHKNDGRRQRSEQSRMAVIKASLLLIDQGVLVPTAKQIAEKAGIGMRSFFRHFEDMEMLFEAIDQHVRDTCEEMFLSGEDRGSLDERIDHFVSSRTRIHERVKNKVLSTQAQLWRSKTLRKNHDRYQRLLRRDLEGWFPEIRELPPSQREALHALASFEMWYRLRHHQKLGARETHILVADMLRSLFV